MREPAPRPLQGEEEGFQLLLLLLLGVWWLVVRGEQRGVEVQGRVDAEAVVQVLGLGVC